ncbi:hypothetical protein PIB30_077307 [Stylosanthes scabra]|uniref:Uncharacterized protein n=1 Tax=Stylosanthes scabra TaxID=79078 RepID=A0ABU6WQD5_9FABA|nr:hypothetical protein [Stylosanthes scabra]
MVCADIFAPPTLMHGFENQPNRLVEPDRNPAGFWKTDWSSLFVLPVLHDSNEHGGFRRRQRQQETRRRLQQLATIVAFHHFTTDPNDEMLQSRRHKLRGW